MQNTNIQFDREALKITIDFGGKEKLVITRQEVDISHFSKGPGGQNVNKSQQGVRLIYCIPETHRRPHIKTRELLVKSIHERSQERNLHHAFSQLVEKLRQYFYVQPLRKKMKVPGKAKRKRLQDKKIHSLKKQGRRQVEF